MTTKLETTFETLYRVRDGSGILLCNAMEQKIKRTARPRWIKTSDKRSFYQSRVTPQKTNNFEQKN